MRSPIIENYGRLTPKEILIKAKALISDPEKWTQGNLAVDAEGRSIHPTNLNACKFCALGACAAVKGTIVSAYLDLLLAREASKILENTPTPISGLNPVAQLNDYLTHADVMTMFDKAIESA